MLPADHGRDREAQHPRPGRWPACAVETSGDLLRFTLKAADEPIDAPSTRSVFSRVIEPISEALKTFVHPLPRRQQRD